MSRFAPPPPGARAGGGVRPPPLQVEMRRVQSIDLFRGSTSPRFGGGGLKTVETARAKFHGTSPRGRAPRRAPARSLTPNARNVETYNFQMPSTRDTSPRREYEYRPAPRNVLRVGEMAPEASKRGKFMPEMPQAAPEKAHKRSVSGVGTNASTGAQRSLSHDGEFTTDEWKATTKIGWHGAMQLKQGGSKKIGAGADLPATQSSIPVGTMGDATALPPPEPHKPSKKADTVAAVRGRAVEPWNGGKVEAPPPTRGIRRAAGADAGAQRLHSFEVSRPPPQLYKVQPPYGTHYDVAMP